MNASTLVEVLVAMVVVMLSFSLAIGLYISVIGSDLAALRLKARAKADEVIAEMVKTNLYLDQEIDEESYSIAITLVPFGADNNRLQELKVVAKNASDKILFEHQRYVLVQ